MSWSRVFVKLTVARMVKKFAFTEPELVTEIFS
jgi:hypothetical protein